MQLKALANKLAYGTPQKPDDQKKPISDARWRAMLKQAERELKELEQADNKNN